MGPHDKPAKGRAGATAGAAGAWAPGARAAIAVEAATEPMQIQWAQWAQFPLSQTNSGRPGNRVNLVPSATHRMREVGRPAALMKMGALCFHARNSNTNATPAMVCVRVVGMRVGNAEQLAGV